MKLQKSKECYDSLNQIFERGIDDFEMASKLCDIIYSLENNVRKYASMRQVILNTHYTSNNEGQYQIINDDHLKEALKKFEELDSLEFEIKKEKISKSKFTYISPKELYFLRAFFEFE